MKDNVTLEAILNRRGVLDKLCLRGNQLSASPLCRGSAYLPTKQLNATPYVTKQQQPTRFNERLSVELDPERRIDGSRTSVQIQSRSEEHISTYTLVFPLMFVLQSFTSLSEAHSHSREVSGYIISTNVSIIEKAETVVRAALI
uniref:Uncharacterized protein n=1 Tax=Timema bartmani TaxID=61472 RepID=A0A7R9ERN9_9NEOP|nr:unnamed protein product [Timema bartmani]